MLFFRSYGLGEIVKVGGRSGFLVLVDGRGEGRFDI